ncbi:MAG TPA: glycosyltransferase 87 family protein, partial [Egibacteraceae bacterium]|nr:glycosyltransferase 87 family protein [Egibacteraceae bacterium]
MAAAAGRSAAPTARLVTGTEALLGAAVAAVAAWEALLWAGPFAAGQDAAPAWWYLPPAAVMLATLLAAWPRRAQLRPGAVVALSALLSVAFLAVHAAVGGPRDQDIVRVYESFGRQVRAGGGLPPAEYPPLALLAFAAAGALGPVPVALPLLLLPLLLAAWWALARLRPDGPWLAAVAALWPTLVPFWEVKYDALPTALTVLGLVAAHRRAWGPAGVLLGLGAAAKLYPGLLLIPFVFGRLR